VLAVSAGCAGQGGNNDIGQGDVSQGDISQGNDGASSVVPAADVPVLVQLKTSLGDIELELNPKKAPYTVENFLHYAQDGFYDGTIFHRVVKDYMIQGGAYLPSLEPRQDGLRDPISSEANNGLSNMRGTIAMSRKHPPASATSEFFINVSDNAGKLDFNPGKVMFYTVFGRVISGMSVVDRIANVEVGSHERFGAGRIPTVPQKAVVIQSIRMRDMVDRDKVLAIARQKREVEKYNNPNWSEKQWRDEYVRLTEEQYGTSFTNHEGGWSYLDVRTGVGPAPFDNGKVQFQYNSWLVKGNLAIESNAHVEFLPYYEINNLIPGLRKALLGMNVGGRRLVILPPDLAFGEEGIPRGQHPIPPDASVIYDLELLDIQPPE
jgi:cyclophilin family peptidyl-prolyl cis-trans isomerase